MVNRIMRDKKGFTLVELVATIALLSIIAIISVVSIINVINESKITNCNSVLDNIRIATKDYFSDNRYNLDAKIEDNDVVVVDTDVYNILTQVLLEDNYISAPIVNPFNNNEINGSSIKVTVRLKKDYTVNKITILNNNSGIEIDCDSSSTLPG